VLSKAKVTADSGFHSRAVVAAIEGLDADVYIADRNHRRREPAFADAGRHKERSRKERALRRRKEREAEVPKSKLFSREDFFYDEARTLCICPAGQRMYPSGRDMLFNGYRVAHFKAPITGCRGCELRAQCLHHPERTPQPQLTIIKGREGPPQRRSKKKGADAVERMRWKFDTPAGRELYSRRMGTVEPVFGNLQNKGMRRFTLRSRKKVNVQWQLFTMVHNIEKIAGAKPPS
jgi:hypothetical protein